MIVGEVTQEPKQANQLVDSKCVRVISTLACNASLPRALSSGAVFALEGD